MTGIHGYFLSVFTAGPALRFQELAIPTVPIVTRTQLAELTFTRNTSEARIWVSSIIWVVLSTYSREIRSIAIWRTAHSWVPSAIHRTRNVTTGPVALGIPLLAIWMSQSTSLNASPNLTPGDACVYFFEYDRSAYRSSWPAQTALAAGPRRLARSDCTRGWPAQTPSGWSAQTALAAGPRRSTAAGPLDLQSDSRYRLQTPHSRLQTPDSRLQTPDCKLQTADCQLQNPDCRVQTADSRLQTPDCKLQTADSRLPTPESRLQTPDSRLPTPDCTLQTPDPRPQAPDCKLQTPDCRLQTAKCQLSRKKAAESRLQTPGQLQTPDWILQLAVCSLESAVWSLEFAVWSVSLESAAEVRSLQSGLCSLDSGVGSLQSGAWSLQTDSRFQTPDSTMTPDSRILIILWWNSATGPS